MPESVVENVLRAFRSVFMSVGVVSLFINLLMLTGPIFMLQVYDRVLASRSIETLVALAGIVVGLYSFFGILEALRTRILTRVGASFDDQLSGPALECEVALPLREGRQAGRAEPVGDVQTVRQFLSGPGPSALFDLPWMPFYLLLVFLFHPMLGLVAAVGAGIVCILIGLNEIVSRKPQRDVAVQRAKRYALIEAARANAESVTAMGMMNGLRQRWISENSENLKLQGKAADIASTVGSIIKTLRFVLQSAILGVGAYLAILEEISPGVMIAASIITARAIAPVDVAVSQWRSFVAARHALERLKNLMNRFSKDSPEMELPLPSSTLTVEHAVISAPGGTRSIVAGASFALSAGDVLGIIGPSGSGKSTLGRALVGIWPAARGHIRLDASDIDQWDTERLGQAIGYLPQDIQLFAGTVAENIARFDPECTSDALLEAAKLADADALIREMPEGYDTQVGDGGAALSGGQRQRIALARALYGMPFLIVLDEPDSNLDHDGEVALAKAILRLKERDCIVVIVAHRPTLMKVMDKLLILRNGQVEQFGPREEVVSSMSSQPTGDAGGLRVVKKS